MLFIRRAVSNAAKPISSSRPANIDSIVQHGEQP